jgi:ribosomal protein S18 acetylase RimI-like enzyme
VLLWRVAAAAVNNNIIMICLLWWLVLLTVVEVTSAFQGGFEPLCFRRSLRATDYTSIFTSNNNVLYSSKSSIDTLQQQIIQGATLKLLKNDVSKSPTPILQQQNDTYRYKNEVIDVPNNGLCTYYVREAQKSEINQITDVLMASFHSQSQQPTFDSYIKRYKKNHLQMCFDAIDESDRGIFVACSKERGEEILVGFCLVDGRTPDPSCKIEFLTPSTLAFTSPRPYLSDLGVIPSHRRQGLGELLVQTCEGWASKRGYETIYLKVEEKNVAGVGLYFRMGYKRTKLPWGRNVINIENRFDTTLLLEKSLANASKRKRRRKWIKEQLWEPMVAALNGNNLPL